MHPSQTIASRGPRVKAMLQKEKGIGDVWLKVVDLHRPCGARRVGGREEREGREGEEGGGNGRGRV